MSIIIVINWKHFCLSTALEGDLSSLFKWTMQRYESIELETRPYAQEDVDITESTKTLLMVNASSVFHNMSVTSTLSLADTQTSEGTWKAE